MTKQNLFGFWEHKYHNKFNGLKSPYKKKASVYSKHLPSSVAFKLTDASLHMQPSTCPCWTKLKQPISLFGSPLSNQHVDQCWQKSLFLVQLDGDGPLWWLLTYSSPQILHKVCYMHYKLTPIFTQLNNQPLLMGRNVQCIVNKFICAAGGLVMSWNCCFRFRTQLPQRPNIIISQLWHCE